MKARETNDAEGRPNVMTAAWVGICCSQPPGVAVSLRKARYSYGNLVARQAFTISVPSEQYVKATDYWGLSSGKEVDKFAKAGLTAVASDLVDAPYVNEFPVVMECKVLHTVEIGPHTRFIGETRLSKTEGRKRARAIPKPIEAYTRLGRFKVLPEVAYLESLRQELQAVEYAVDSLYDYLDRDKPDEQPRQEALMVTRFS